MNNITPLMLKLIFPNKKYVQFLGEVKTSAIRNGGELHPDGLYSTKIFGELGTDNRYDRFGYIDLNTELLHPRIYYYLTKISSLYKKVMESKAYVVFDKKTKTLIEVPDGDTGYSYFLKILPELDLGSSDSDDRQNMIDVVNKYRDKGLLTNRYLLVIPAGLRDVEIDIEGRVKEVDINDYYKSIINNAQLLKNISVDTYTLDILKIQLQNKVQNLMDQLFILINGKKKLLRGHWTSRKVEFGSRNVATGKSIIIDDLEESDIDIVNTASVALIQYIKVIDPVTKYNIISKFTSNIFNSGDGTAYLYNPKTKMFEDDSIDDRNINDWTTGEGLDNIMNQMLDLDFTNSDIIIDNKWMIPVLDNGNNIKIYLNNDKLEDIDKDKLRPITYGELFYLAIYDEIDRIPGIITRYPVTEQGSTIPVKMKVNTTVESRKVLENLYSHIDTIENKIIYNYPKLNSYYDSSISPSYTSASGLGLDYDGDKISLTAVLSDEAIEEIQNYFNRVNNYIDPMGNLIKEVFDKPTKLVIKFLARD